jgi:hypothetical protein
MIRVQFIPTIQTKIFLPEVILLVECRFLATIINGYTNERLSRCDQHHILHTCTVAVIRSNNENTGVYILENSPPPPHCLGKKYGLRCKRYQKTKQALTKIRRKRKKRQGKKRKVTK